MICLSHSFSLGVTASIALMTTGRFPLDLLWDPIVSSCVVLAEEINFTSTAIHKLFLTADLKEQTGIYALM